jgi:hypothetical protein
MSVTDAINEHHSIQDAIHSYSRLADLRIFMLAQALA